MELQTLWSSVRDHDSHRAFHQLFENQWQRCFTIAYKMLRDKELAEDLVQEAFTDLWNRREQLQLQNPEAFLTQIIKNKAFTALSRTRIPTCNLEVLENLQGTSSPEELYVLEELQTEIQEAIEQLPPRCREVFIMKRYEELSTDEIAAKLNMSIRTVEHHLYQAGKFLKNTLQPIILLLILEQMI